MKTTEKNTEIREWTCCGDPSLISEGGLMVRPAWPESIKEKCPALSTQYEVLMVMDFPEKKNAVLASIKYVDIDDYADDMDAIRSAYGDIPDDPCHIAAYCAEYTGIEPGIDRAYRQEGMYSLSKDFIISRKAAAKWCRELGVPAVYIA